MTNTDFYIEMLGQEGIEIAHRISKIKIFGTDEKQPGQPYTNLERLNQEFNDLLAVREELEELGIELFRDPVLIKKKKQKMQKMFEYATEGFKPDKHTEDCTRHYCTHGESADCTMMKYDM